MARAVSLATPDASPQAYNKQLQRPVGAHRGDAARAPFHYARASRSNRQRAAAELQR
jgi:hypothetical protein